MYRLPCTTSQLGSSPRFDRTREERSSGYGVWVSRVPRSSKIMFGNVGAPTRKLHVTCLMLFLYCKHIRKGYCRDIAALRGRCGVWTNSCGDVSHWEISRSPQPNQSSERFTFTKSQVGPPLACFPWEWDSRERESERERRKESLMRVWCESDWSDYH